MCLIVPVCCELHLCFIHPCSSCLSRDEVAVGDHRVHSCILLLIHWVSALPFLRSLALRVRSRLCRNPCQKEIWGMSHSGCWVMTISVTIMQSKGWGFALTCRRMFRIMLCQLLFTPLSDEGKDPVPSCSLFLRFLLLVPTCGLSFLKGVQWIWLSFR